MIIGLFDNGALPVLEHVAQFTGRRHEVLTNNIANLSTPFFKPTDLDTDAFQQVLAKAIDRRRSGPTPTDGPLPLYDVSELTFRDNAITDQQQRAKQGILFHDENTRDLERIMQHLAENTMVHNTSIEMIRNQFDMLRTAIRERI